jgi:hypothetical protein
MAKSKTKLETRMRVLELAAEIAAEAAQNTNVIWMIESGGAVGAALSEDDGAPGGRPVQGTSWRG